MNITFLGGAGEYGRSCFLLEFSTYTFLIDCGVMKSGHTVREQYPRLTRKLAQEVDAVFLTHAHEDHTGALPYFAELGFQGEIYATEETIQQTAYYLKNWRETQLRKFGSLPYGEESEAKLDFQTLEQWDRSIPGFHFTYGRSGHLPGSVWYIFTYERESVFFSGDFSFESLLLQYDFPKNTGQVISAVVDGAYGSETRTQDKYCREMMKQVAAVKAEGYSVVLIAPPYGRAQDLLFLLKNIETNIIVDAPIFQAAQDYLAAKEWFKPNVYEAYHELVHQLQVGVDYSAEKSFIAVYSERTLLEQSTVIDDEEKIAFIFTGPVNEQIIERIEKNKIGKYKLLKAGYKVHPAIYETEKLLHLLQPAETFLTHSKADVSEPLASKLQQLTGLNVKTAPIMGLAQK